MTAVDAEKSRKAQQALRYRATLLHQTAEGMKLLAGTEHTWLRNIMIECFAMQVRILLDFLGVKPPKGSRTMQDDLRATDIRPGWVPPPDPSYPAWVHEASVAAAHMTTGVKPDWSTNKAEAIFAELQKLIHGIDVDQELRDRIAHCTVDAGGGMRGYTGADPSGTLISLP